MAGLRRRTRLFIARRFQIRYISLILIFMFATAILSGYTVYVTTWIMFGEKLAAVYPQGLLLDIVKKVNMVLLLRLVFLSPLVILVGLMLSNRIAGPIYRIQRFISRVSAGNYDNRLKLREKDELQDIADSLNHMVSRLGSEKKARHGKLDDLRKKTGELEAALIAGGHDKEDLLRRVIDIKEHLATFR